MNTINIHEAATQLPQLIECVLAGESLIITECGKPLVRLVAVEAVPTPHRQRLGFMQGQFHVPDDFDRMGAEDIEAMFFGLI